MKKIIFKWIIGSVCILLFLVCIYGLKIYNDFFPMAEPIYLPNNGEIIAIEITKDTFHKKYTNPEIINTIIEQLSKARETRILTVHDLPPVMEYYTVDIITEDTSKVYTSFIYQENSKWYIEQPYRGVYEITEDIFTLLIEGT